MRLERHVGDFVQIERAVMGEFEQPRLVGAVRLLDAEQFRLDPFGRHGGAIDRHERIGGAAGPSVQQARRHFLARAGWTGNQHPAVGRRDLFDQSAQLRNDRRLADQLAIVAGLQFQFLHFALQSCGLEGALDNMQQAVGLERLFNEIVGALLDRRYRRFDGAVTGDHHHRHIGLFALERIQDLNSVQLRTLQPDIENDELRPARPRRRQRSLAIARQARVITLIPQNT